MRQKPSGSLKNLDKVIAQLRQLTDTFLVTVRGDGRAYFRIAGDQLDDDNQNKTMVKTQISIANI